MISYSGKSVFPEFDDRHTGEAPTTIDVAVGLARQIRFSGQTMKAHSVLCHTLVVGELLRETDGFIHGLLHDAPEAILGDVVTTWKLPGTEADEAHLLDLIYRDLGIELPTKDQAALVKAADMAALAAEAHALGHMQAEKYWPKRDFDDLAHRAFSLTVAMMQENLTVRMLVDPSLAINVYTGVLTQALNPGRNITGLDDVVQSIQQVLG